MLFLTLFRVFFGPMQHKWEKNMGKKVLIKVYQVKIEVKYVFFLAKKVVIYAIFGGKLFPKTCVSLKFVGVKFVGVKFVGVTNTNQ